MSHAAAAAELGRIVVLGIGNTLMTDDGAGVHVVRALDERRIAGLALRDGGTIGLTLLSEIERDSALIAIDAMEMGAEPGTVRLFFGADMDRALSGFKTTAHEVALSDLLQAAMLSGILPDRRALVGIQPGEVGLGLEMTAPVAAAVVEAADRIEALAGEWRDAG